uniref:Saposin B-type domain-containing protein n=1 Tax=Rhabditophanes sp. KR3021 TaxID=114890 RepID=A0AC35U9M6_9BILA
MSKLLFALVALLAVIYVAVAQSAWTSCHSCTFVLGKAEHHFRNGTSEARLKHELTRECTQLAKRQGNAAGQACLKEITLTIDILYADFEKGLQTCDICLQIKECLPSDNCVNPVFPTRNTTA